MALLLAGAEFLVFDVVLRDKPAALLALSPKGTVPVLHLPEGGVLEESWDIMRWALEPADRGGWWSRAQSPENLALLRHNDGDFKAHLDRYKYPERSGLDAAAREALRAHAVTTWLVPLDARLARHAYLGGSAACATDMAVFPFIRQFAAVDPSWFEALPLPALQNWLNAWLASSLFEACMTKLPSQTATVFPAWQSTV